MMEEMTDKLMPDELALPLEAADIMRIIPHRYPFLLIDRVVELEPGKRVVAIKNVTANEPQFTGHFPDRPIMPGVLMVEALAQAGAVAVRTTGPRAAALGCLAGGVIGAPTGDGQLARLAWRGPGAADLLTTAMA